MCLRFTYIFVLGDFFWGFYGHDERVGKFLGGQLEPKSRMMCKTWRSELSLWQYLHHGWERSSQRFGRFRGATEFTVLKHIGGILGNTTRYDTSDSAYEDDCIGQRRYCVHSTKPHTLSRQISHTHGPYSIRILHWGQYWTNTGQQGLALAI
jgi:hypothetical protein